MFSWPTNECLSARGIFVAFSDVNHPSVAVSNVAYLWCLNSDAQMFKLFTKSPNPPFLHEKPPPEVKIHKSKIVFQISHMWHQLPNHIKTLIPSENMLISKISSSKKWQQRRWCLWISSSGEFIIFSILYSPPPASPNDRIGIIACSDRGQWFYWSSSSSSQRIYWSRIVVVGGSTEVVVVVVGGSTALVV